MASKRVFINEEWECDLGPITNIHVYSKGAYRGTFPNGSQYYWYPSGYSGKDEPYMPGMPNKPEYWARRPKSKIPLTHLGLEN